MTTKIADPNQIAGHLRGSFAAQLCHLWRMVLHSALVEQLAYSALFELSACWQSGIPEYYSQLTIVIVVVDDV